MGTNFDLEMQRALEADGEKLRQLTGEDHGPAFIADGHTPGPWVALDQIEVAYGLKSWEVRQADTAPTDEHHFPARICVSPPGVHRAGPSADARLIAAAPALLAALQAFLPELEQRERFISANDSAWSQSEKDMLDRIWKARKAVSDATGERV